MASAGIQQTTVQEYTKFTQDSYNSEVNVVVSNLYSRGETTEKTLKGGTTQVSVLPTINKKYIEHLQYSKEASEREMYHTFKTLREKLLKEVKSEWNCETCRSRIEKMLNYVDLDCCSFICSKHATSSNPLHKQIHDSHNQLLRFYKKITDGENWSATIVHDVEEFCHVEESKQGELPKKSKL